MARLTDHLLVISFDCLSSLDFRHVREVAEFSRAVGKSIDL